MHYILAFLEGIATFISPCLLPMLPIYISYFGGGTRNTAKTIKCSLGFIIGFTLVFTAMGTLAATVGAFLIKYRNIVNVICGCAVIVFGLNYLGFFKLKIFSGTGANNQTKNLGFFSSLLFGIIFSVGWTPCIGAFLGSALMLASTGGKVLTGTIMLMCYSFGLGIPFLICAFLIDRLKSLFDVIKRNYNIINKICGVYLVIVGVAMATGVLGRIITLIG